MIGKTAILKEKHRVYQWIRRNLIRSGKPNMPTQLCLLLLMMNRVMLLLQLIIAFQSQLDNTAILSCPRDVLEFVRHALEVSETHSSAAVSGMSDRGISNERRKTLLREDLRILPEEPNNLEIGPDSDDDDDGEGEDMVETAVGLLLAVLEGSSLSLIENNKN